MKKLLAIMLAVVMSLVLASCAAPVASVAPSAATTAPTVAPTATPTPVSLNAYFGSEPGSIDPSINETVDGSVYLYHFYEGLTRYDAASGDIVLGQAASIDSTDGLNYTVKINPNAKWSDGKAVRAQDFEYSWKRLLDPATGATYGATFVPYFKDGNDITKVAIKAVDDSTLTFTLAKPCGYLNTLLNFPNLFPLREDIVKGNDKWTQDPSTYVTNGRYVLKAWDHDSQIVAEKSPTYYDAATTKVDTINFKLFADDASAYAAYTAGQLDYDTAPPSGEAETYQKLPDYELKPALGTYYLALNCTKKPLDDAKVRMALNLAIDRSYIVKNVTKGGQVPAYAWVPNGIPDAAAGSDFRTVGGNLYESDMTKAIAQAKQLLIDAGYPGGKGLPKIEFTYNTSASHQAIAEAVAHDWSTNLGIKVQLKNMEWNAFVEYRNKKEHQVARDGWIGDWVDPSTFMNLQLSTNGTNDAGYNNPAYDAAMAASDTTANVADRYAKLHDAEKLMMADAPIVPIYFYTDENLAKTYLTGQKEFVTGAVLFWNCTVAAH